MRWSAAQTLSWIIRKTPLELTDWTSDMGPMIKDAQKKLARVIASGEVQAWGRKKPHEITEKIPNDPFRIPGCEVAVGVYGDMGPLIPHKPYNGPRWHFVEFEADEIQKALPKPPSPPVMEWMQKEAEQLHAQGSVGKRDDMVKRCMKAANCTKREAEAAHKSLPESLKRKKGKPPKTLG